MGAGDSYKNGRPPGQNEAPPGAELRAAGIKKPPGGGRLVYEDDGGGGLPEQRESLGDPTAKSSTSCNAGALALA